ncbi:ABC transporter permease, partial [bacterium]|nr:ABC transporter permease [bacterium]
PVEQRPVFLYNPELRSTNFIVPGLIAIIQMMLAALLTSTTIVRERGLGTIESLIVSPIKPWELMVGKIVPYMLIAFGDVLMVIFMAVFIFRVPLLGNPLLVLVTSGIFLMAALGIGLLISTLANTQQTAMSIALMGTQLPTVMMSGFIFPISSMPEQIRWLTNLIPATHFVKILRSIFLKGSGFWVLLKPILILILLGVIALFLSSARFKKKL